MAAFAVVCVTVYGVWSVEAGGFAGTSERIAILLIQQADAGQKLNRPAQIRWRTISSNVYAVS